MIKINVEDKIKPTDDYKVGDILMRVDNGYGFLDDSALYFVSCIILGDSTKKYTLVPITEHHQVSAEQSFNSLNEMIKYYRRFNVLFAKVDVSINVKLSS